MSPKNADRMANSVDCDQTAPLISVYTVCLEEQSEKELHCLPRPVYPKT